MQHGNRRLEGIAGEGADVLGDGEFVAVKALQPGEHADARVRIRAGENAKAGTGCLVTVGHSCGEDGQCGFDDISRFGFTVLAVASAPETGEDAEGRPGHGGNAPAQQGAVDGGNKPARQGALKMIPVSGALAAVGFSSALPTVAALGGLRLLGGCRGRVRRTPPEGSGRMTGSRPPCRTPAPATARQPGKAGIRRPPGATAESTA